MANYPPAHLAIAVDASYIVRMLLPVEQATITLDQFANWRQARVDICTLDILIADVTSVIRQAVCRQWITAAEGQVRSTVCWKNFPILNYAMNRSCWLDEKDCASPRYKTQFIRVHGQDPNNTLIHQYMLRHTTIQGRDILPASEGT
jgi:hypothetical protein